MALIVVSWSGVHRGSMSSSNLLTHVHRIVSAAVLTGSVVALSACGSSAAPTTARSPANAPSSASAPSASAPSSPASGSSSVSAVPAETAPPGDIPDNLAFVRYGNQKGHYSFTHPEGWAENQKGTRVQFTDKLNGVIVDTLAANQAQTVATARSTEVPRLKAATPAFELRDVSPITVPAGTAVRIVYRRNSDPDAVTGKVYRDEVEEYLVFSGGRLVRMELFGPVGADNVDAYRTMSQSLRIR